MTQEEFNRMLLVALGTAPSGGYYRLSAAAEQLDKAIDGPARPAELTIFPYFRESSYHVYCYDSTGRMRDNYIRPGDRQVQYRVPSTGSLLVVTGFKTPQGGTTITRGHAGEVVFEQQASDRLYVCVVSLPPVANVPGRNYAIDIGR